MMANFLLKPLQRVAHFVQMVPDFAQLEPDDQMSLLNTGGALEIMICSSSNLYDHLSNKLMNLVSRENYSTPPNSLSAIQLDILKMIWSEV